MIQITSRKMNSELFKKIFKKLFSSQLRINMMSGMAATVANLAVTAVSYPLYLHFLGYEKYGLWLILATVMSFTQLGNLGLGPAVMKLVAEEYGRDHLAGIEQYTTTAIAMLFGSGTVILLILLSMKGQIVSLFKLNDANAHMVLFLLPFVGCLSIYTFVVQVFGAVLSGLGRMDLANYIQTLAGIIQVIVSGFFLVTGHNVTSLLYGSIASCLTIHGLTLMAIRRIKPLGFLRRRNISVQRGRHLFSFGGNVFAGSLVNMLLSPFNKVMLTRYVGVAAVPVYELAFTSNMQVRGFVESGLRGITPEISRMSSETSTDAQRRISHLYRRTLKMTFLFGIPLYTVLMVFAPLLLKIWLGARFVQALPVAFRVMLIGAFVSLVGVPAYYTLLGLGRARHIFASHLFQGVANMIAILAVVSLFHISVGSIIWCTAFAMMVSTVYLLYLNSHIINRFSEAF